MKKSDVMELLIGYQRQEIDQLKDERWQWQSENHNNQSQPMLLAFEIGDTISIFGLKYKVVQQNRGKIQTVLELIQDNNNEHQ